MHGETVKLKVLLCSTDTSLYIYICVKHFGIANIKLNPYGKLVVKGTAATVSVYQIPFLMSIN